MYLNIQSLLANKTELSFIVNSWKPFVICLSETHVTDQILDHEIHLPGYYFIDTLSHSRHTGGTIIYIKEELVSKTLLTVAHLNNVWITGVEIIKNSQKLLVFCIYHSPTSSDADFLSYMEDFLEEYASKEGTLICIGDFNIDMSKNTYYSERFRKLILENGLYQNVNNFTRVTTQSSTIIDLLITNNKHLKPQVHMTPKITDHSIITTNVDIMGDNDNIVKFYRDYKNVDELKFQVDLMDTKWNTNCTDIDTLADTLVESISILLNQYAPLKQKTIKKQWADKQWWTIEIDLNIQKRDQLYRRATITKSDQDFNEYRTQRNKVVNMIRQQKSIYYNSKIDLNKGNSTEMWKTIKKLIGGKAKPKKAGIFFEEKIEIDNNIIVENFNNYFIKSIETITMKISGQDIVEIVGRIDQCNSSMEKFKPMSLVELKNTVNKLKKKSSSVDGITTNILQKAFEVIGERFLQLVNCSLEYGTFPKHWKKTTIIPIEKIANTNKAEEFRPINMVPVYEKLLEVVVNNQFIEYFEKNNLLSEYQAGFRKNNSCESALQSVLMNWKSALSKKNIIGVVFLDFRRAFETIDRGMLIEKLKKYGVQDVVLKWFETYLSNRTQETKYFNNTSTEKENLFGVPQGTVLGPNLFVVYINDIVRNLKECKIQLFADDTLLYVEGQNVQEVVNTINKELETLYEWLVQNGLSLNTEKTKFMIIKSKFNIIPTRSHTGILINSKRIEQVEQCKYLGVVVDEYLTFSKHAEYITNKIAKKVNLMKRMSSYLSSWAKQTIYKTIILPHYNYCSTILFLLNSTEKSILQKKQNQAMRCIIGCNRYTSVNTMLQTTGLLSVKQIFFMNTMSFIYKVKHNLLPEHLLKNTRFITDVHDYPTRAREDFYVSMVSTNYSQNDVFHNGLIQYNSLPYEIKNSSTMQTFKRKCIIYCKNNINL